PASVPLSPFQAPQATQPATAPPSGPNANPLNLFPQACLPDMGGNAPAGAIARAILAWWIEKKTMDISKMRYGSGALCHDIHYWIGKDTSQSWFCPSFPRRRRALSLLHLRCREGDMSDISNISTVADLIASKPCFQIRAVVHGFMGHQTQHTGRAEQIFQDSESLECKCSDDASTRGADVADYSGDEVIDMEGAHLDEAGTHETKRFLSYFKPCIIPQADGVTSGFTNAKAEEHKIRMFICQWKHIVHVKEASCIQEKG
ncbi:villin-4-like protein, partial [Tanacetum coccineum]